MIARDFAYSRIMHPSSLEGTDLENESDTQEHREKKKKRLRRRYLTVRQSRVEEGRGGLPSSPCSCAATEGALLCPGVPAIGCGCVVLLSGRTPACH